MADGRLAEVEEDAIRIQTKRFNDFFEEQQYKAAKRAEKASKPKREEVDESPPVEANTPAGQDTSYEPEIKKGK